MQFLIAEISAGRGVESIYEDPPAARGSVEDALSNTLISQLDLAPLAYDEADRMLEALACKFNRSQESDPILWVGENRTAAIKLNGVLVVLESAGEDQPGAATFAAPGTTVSVRILGGEADWRANAELVFGLNQGLSVGYRGFYSCSAS